MTQRPFRRREITRTAMLLVAASAGLAQAAPLNPNAFSSLGTLNVTSGSITINTNTLAITGAATFNGGTVSQGAGNPEVAVFTFSNFNIGAGVTINVTGSRPLALLSQGTMGIASAISLNGGNGAGSMAGAAGPAGGYAGGAGGAGMAGGGPGGGTSSGLAGAYGGAGGGYGGAGGAGEITSGSSTGGAAYGDLTTLLQGGSGGGGGPSLGGGGGGGGGAIELGALGTLTLSATLTSNGGQAGDFTYEGGGGAGGGILLHAPTYSLTSLSALGGLGSINFTSPGGGGGGGRIALAGGQLSLPQISSLSASVHGGIAQTSGGAVAGKAGVLTFKPDMLDVQAGQTANIGIIAGQTGRTDARIELLPTSFSVLGGGTASLVPTSTYIQPAGGSINIAGGQFNVTANLQISAGATLNLSSGTLNIGAGPTLIVNGRAAFSQPYEISNLAAVQITAGGDLTSNSSFDIANTNANGQLFVSGAGSTINTPSGAIWGLTPGNSGTVTFASNGAGTFGTVVMSGQGGTTSLSLQSNGQMTTTFGLRAGPSIGSGSITINIAGGTLNNLGTADFRGGARVNLSSGGLILANGGTFSPGSTLNWTGGTVNLAAGRTLAFDGGVGSTSLGSVSLPNGSTLRITNGGRFDAAGLVDIAATAGTTGTLFVDGVNSRFTTGPSFQFWANGTGSAATVTFSNQAAGTFDSVALAASGGGSGFMNILGGGSVRATNFIAGSSTGVATINLAGTLNVGSMTLAGSSILSFNSGSFSSTGTAGFANTAQMLFSTGRNKVARVGGLAFSGSSRVDLSDNALIVDYTGATPFTTVRNQIIAGRSGGTWLGNSLTSSAAAATPGTGLGIAEAAALGSPATFLGQPIDATAILVRHTLLGDADLSGGVNLDDFTRLAASFGLSSTWTGGDFNYDGVANLDDFTALAANFGLSLPSDATRGAVPDPVSAPVGCLGLAAALFRRRRA